MDIKDMLYITAIAEEKTLSAAGKKLSVSQPTLSIFLSELEEKLGENLFYHEKKQLIPTAAGKIYLEAASKIIRIHDQTYLSIHRLQHPDTECITIAATPFRGSILFANIYPFFFRRFPDIRLELRESYMQNILKEVQEGTADFAFGSFADTENADFDYVTFSKEELVLAVPSFHRMFNPVFGQEKRPKSVSVEEFAEDSFVLMSQGTTIRRISDGIFKAAGIHPPIVFESNNNLVVENMIRQGMGVGFLPRSMARTAEKDIVFFSVRPGYYITLGMILKKGKKLRKAERYLAYLAMMQDRGKPEYMASENKAAGKIIREFT